MAPEHQELRIDTVEKFHAAGYTLTAHCDKCMRFVLLDLAGMIERGEGGRLIKRMRTRCTVCGGIGKWQVRGVSNYDRG